MTEGDFSYTEFIIEKSAFDFVPWEVVCMTSDDFSCTESRVSLL